MRRAALAVLSLSAMSCNPAIRPPETGRSDLTGVALGHGEVAEMQLETTLHELDLLEAQIHSSGDVSSKPITACMTGDREVVARNMAFKLAVGKRLVQEKDVEAKYYALLQEASPDELMPVIHLRKHYYEGLLGCVLYWANGGHREPKEDSSIAILMASNFEAEISKSLIMVEFMTHWCVPCKKMAPDLEKFAHDHKSGMKVGKLNTDRNMELAQRFGAKNFPTLIMLKDGREIGRLEGYCNYSDLQKWTEGVIQGERSSPSGRPPGDEQKRGAHSD
jgi:thioredoxin